MPVIVSSSYIRRSTSIAMHRNLVLVVFVSIGFALVVESRIIWQGVIPESRPTQTCTYDGRTYFDGDIVTTNSSSNLTYCVQQHRCTEGRLILVYGGCEFDGSCRYLGRQFNHSCSLKECVYEPRNGQFFYRIAVRAPRCLDYQGICRDDRDHYADIKDGQRYESCHCVINPEEADSQCD